jgi:hypothetical protein
VAPIYSLFRCFDRTFVLRVFRLKQCRYRSSSVASKLAEDLVRQGFKITDDTVGRILKEELGYSLQAPSKQKEGTAHPDRDAQFNYLNKQIGLFAKAGEPVISVDTKKKEIVGEFSNGGAEWHPVGEPTRTKTHDFVDKVLYRVVGRFAPFTGSHQVGRSLGLNPTGTEKSSRPVDEKTIGLRGDLVLTVF